MVTFKKSYLSLRQLLFLVACFALLCSFTIFVLEKTHVTNFYNKPVVVETESNTRPVNSVDYSAPTDSDKTNQKNESVETSDKAQILDQQQTNPSPITDNISINITESSQNENTVYIRAIITGTTTGTCNLIMKNGQSEISKSVPVASQANYVICQGFNIPTSEFPNAGTWQTTISLSGSSATASVNVNVKK